MGHVQTNDVFVRGHRAWLVVRRKETMRRRAFLATVLYQPMTLARVGCVEGSRVDHHRS
jgi:hypothetical protein